MWTHELLTPPPSISFLANLETPQLAGPGKQAGPVFVNGATAWVPASAQALLASPDHSLTLPETLTKNGDFKT